MTFESACILFDAMGPAMRERVEHKFDLVCLRYQSVREAFTQAVSDECDVFERDMLATREVAGHA